MGSNDLNRKYTIERYCSRIEVAKAIGTNLIEPLWKEIVTYRKAFARPLPFADAFKIPFSLTYIDSVHNKNNEISNTISSYIYGIDKLADSKIAYRTFTSEMLKQSLKYVARFNKIDASEITLQLIVEGKCYDETYRPLINYYNALRHLSNKNIERIDEETLAEFYAALRGEDELTSFYRLNDNLTYASKALVDREYDNGVPAHMIEEMVNNILSYANDKDTSITARAIAVLFMFNYIKPFNEHNNELACLLVKCLFASTDIASAAMYIPLESILLDNEFYGNYFKEVLKTKDFTYCFIEGSTKLIDSFTTAVDRIVQVNAHALDRAAKLGDDSEKIKKEFGIEVEKDEPVVSPIKKEPVITPAPKPVQVVEIPEEKDLTERELKALENDILESNPFIKKGQAHFYVRHCTKGKFYTIQQYKKFEGCVYETARTSMDNLAVQGYYRREQIKNKFVYTPIDKE